MLAFKTLQRLFAAQLLLLLAPHAMAAGIYSQLVVSFPNERVVQHSYHKGEHALVLAFKKTAPSELAALEHYDERLIKRVLIKDLGSEGTEVKLILRDRDVHANIAQFTEPFRIAVDLFDADYQEDRDPTTGMPLVSTGGDSAAPATADGDATAPTQASGHLRMLAPNGDVESAGQAPAQGSRGSGKKRHLLEANDDVMTQPEELQAGLRAADDGIGKAWSDFPPYIYRLQTAALEQKDERERAGAHAAKAVASAAAMAEYAGKLYNFGNETKALVAYEQVLRKDATVFDRDALHLWKFAEIQLGQGNFTLAQGYFEALTQRHPESPLANYARLRLLDVAALRKLADGSYQTAASLVPKLKAIKAQRGELAAQVSMREAFWEAAASSKGGNPKALVPLKRGAYDTLLAAYGNVESSRTAFLSASLLLNQMLAADQPWQHATGTFADAYFKRFTGAAAEPYRGELKDALLKKLTLALQAKVSAGKLLEATADFEALPSSLRSVKKDPKTAWALGEAYRKLGQNALAADFYAAAKSDGSDGPDLFRAQFWLSVTAGERAEELRKANGDADQVARLAAQSRNADKAAGETWQRLKDDERRQLSVAYKDAFEKTVNGQAKLRTGLKIVLANWTDALSTKVSTQNGGDEADWKRNFSPSGSAVILLTDLAKRFAELGMADERRKATALLKFMKPKDFADDTAAKTVWASELVKLAEEYRRANQYLDAGRLFNLVGAEAENFDGRAEALYKGGLLLYRAGRRAEALESFKKASDDGNNLFYANLAKERLSQLQ